MRLLIASHKLGKQEEVLSLLAGLGLELIVPQQLPELKSLTVNESGQTICENARLKAIAFSQKTKLSALADDSCLQIEALDGLPGVHSKRFFPGSGSDRNQEILKRLSGQSSRRAVFSACLCLAESHRLDRPEYFEGQVRGTIAISELGNAGFDYDRIFIPDGHRQTFAQLGIVAKNKLSHRHQALIKLKAYLVQHA